MNQLSVAERAKAVACLIEGCSIRSTVRITGFAKKTVQRLVVDMGKACRIYHDEHVRGVKCKRVQVDEIWAFVYAKKKNVPQHKRGEAGDAWTWVGMDVDSKLIISWVVGERDANAAYWFVHDLKERLASRIQLTSDGLRCYLEAVESAFGAEIDYAQLVKLYGGSEATGPTPTEVRYSPPICTGTRTNVVQGAPDPQHVSTSHIERQNLTMRMGMRRFTRLTNGFSKKWENHEHAVALHFMHYNFCRIHQTLRVTPAMEAGLTDHLWSVEELVERVLNLS
jgi:IS1 family transposase